MYYEIKVYRINGAVQEGKMDAFLKDAFYTCSTQAGIKTVGVFKPVEADTAFGKLVYVLYLLIMWTSILTLKENLRTMLYTRMREKHSSTLRLKKLRMWDMRAFHEGFSGMPALKLILIRLLRLSGYMSWEAMKVQPRQKLQKRSICSMKEGRSVSLRRSAPMPYFTAGAVRKPETQAYVYDNLCWHEIARRKMAAFRVHPDWMTLKAKPEYASTTSKTNAYLLHPTSYSDFNVHVLTPCPPLYSVKRGTGTM